MDVTLAAGAKSYDQALEEVKARVAKSRSSFHAGMAILPKARREAMYALYAFCREVDDIADESATPEAAAGGLALWKTRIAALFHGEAEDSITRALLPAISAFSLVEDDFQAIIAGMEMDAAVIRAPDEPTFDLYCDRVASAVGRVSVRIFGDAGADAMRVAHHLGRALQITNILRDLGEDAARGRLYIPAELLAKHDMPSDPAAVLRNPRLPAACAELAKRAHTHFDGADQAMRLCKPAAMRPARVMRGYYGAVLARLERTKWRDPAMRVRLPSWQKALLILRHGVF